MSQTQLSHQQASSKGGAHAYATPIPSHAFSGGLGPASLPCPVSSQGIHFLSSSIFAVLQRSCFLEGGVGIEVKPLPQGQRLLSLAGAISSPDKCCEEQNQPLGAAAGVKPPAPACTAGGSAAQGGLGQHPSTPAKA